MNLSIVIASHGDDSWRKIASERAYPSALEQGAHEVLVEHWRDGTRADVRNELTRRATGDWICTLDADDELAPGYADAMAQAWSFFEPASEIGFSPLLTPQVQYVHPGRREEPKFWPECDLLHANWMVVGTVVRRDLLLEVGGWRTFMGSGELNQWDDWDLWQRCVLAGAQPVKVQEAIYVAHVSPTSRHHHRARSKTRQFWFHEIRRANYPELY